MGKYLCRVGKALLKGFVWILACSLPTALLACFFDTETIATIAVSVIFMLNPIYISIINYRFISKKNAFFIWLFLALMQTPWYFPLIFRENDEWIGIGILISYIGHYQIIGITICFAIACLVKYIVYRHKAKKALEKAPMSEDDGTATN